jgi:hypothetical protein
VVFLHSAASPVGETTNYDVDSITPANPQIGQKNLHIGPSLGPVPGSGPFPPGGAQMREYIEFHNPGPEPRLADFVFDLRPLPPELHMWLRFSKLDTQAPLRQSLTGIRVIHDPDDPDLADGEVFAGIDDADEIREWLDCWLEAEEHERHRRDDHDDQRDDEEEDDEDNGRGRRKRHPELRFTPAIYRASPASLVAVRGVRLAPYGAAAALLVIENTGQLPPGTEYRFQVQQVVGKQVAGGSTYVVRIAGEPELPPPIVVLSHQVDPKTGKPPVKPPVPLRYVPPWMTDIVEERAEVLGKFPPEQDMR